MFAQYVCLSKFPDKIQCPYLWYLPFITPDTMLERSHKQSHILLFSGVSDFSTLRRLLIIIIILVRGSLLLISCLASGARSALGT